MIFVHRFVPVVLGLLVAGCASYQPVTDSPVRIGPPYRVKGVTYVPADQPAYDEVGTASWYGSESGNRTARGEKFRPKWISAAHKTLPLPSYVEVTNLDTGRTALVRVNDRGPFAQGRIIDLSRGAAELLGIRTQGHAPVRVRRVDPPEKDRKRLRKGKPARDRAALSGAALAAQRSRIR
ncbi:septal ring lytic transglycosylase RlpA family protein [Sphingobium sp. ZW T5_29]|uniref:septal ring lytic transglycosylase RlpA family protein n=1 Tax=Sphingobium sp. ZW T5_29 TaxID=3378077 RepID=UPI0038537988